MLATLQPFEQDLEASHPIPAHGPSQRQAAGDEPSSTHELGRARNLQRRALVEQGAAHEPALTRGQEPHAASQAPETLGGRGRNLAQFRNLARHRSRPRFFGPGLILQPREFHQVPRDGPPRVGLFDAGHQPPAHARRCFGDRPSNQRALATELAALARLARPATMLAKVFRHRRLLAPDELGQARGDDDHVCMRPARPVLFDDGHPTRVDFFEALAFEQAV